MLNLTQYPHRHEFRCGIVSVLIEMLQACFVRRYTEPIPVYQETLRLITAGQPALFKIQYDSKKIKLDPNFGQLCVNLCAYKPTPRNFRKNRGSNIRLKRKKRSNRFHNFYCFGHLSSDKKGSLNLI